MYFSVGLIAAVLAAGAQAVVFEFGATGFVPQEGVPITIGVSGNTGPYTVTVKNGPRGDLKEVQVIVSDGTDSTFTWVPEGLPSDTYALEITDGSDTNYSPQFTYAGTAQPTTSASETTTSADSTTSSMPLTTEMTSSSNFTMTTMTTSSSTKIRTTSTSSSAEETTAPVNTNGDSGSQRIGASLALAAGAAALLAFFN